MTMKQGCFEEKRRWNDWVSPGAQQKDQGGLQPAWQPELAREAAGVPHLGNTFLERKFIIGKLTVWNGCWTGSRGC